MRSNDPILPPTYIRDPYASGRPMKVAAGIDQIRRAPSVGQGSLEPRSIAEEHMSRFLARPGGGDDGNLGPDPGGVSDRNRENGHGAFIL